MHLLGSSVRFLTLAIASSCVAATLPVVDLGYELHQAISFDEAKGGYNFTNIRYAAPPVGDLRFRAPEPPTQNRSQIQTGKEGRICPQAQPIWTSDIVVPFLTAYLRGKTYKKSSNVSDYPYVPKRRDPRATEDCLFLDVVVPKDVFSRGGNGTSTPPRKLAPVVVWIYGGGYTTGDKSIYDPSGLIKRSTSEGMEGIVYVGLNYRLGVFGWLAGKSLTSNGTANAALWDQQLALEWVHKYIHLFGGDPDRITVMGESAGGGSIMHHITAFGGGSRQPQFQRAILQSPAWVYQTSPDVQEAQLQQYLEYLGVDSVEEARLLPSEKLMAANEKQVAKTSLYGTNTYGPVVDGTFVPDLPAQLLRQGRFHKNITVMSGHNLEEGLMFSSPDSQKSDAFSGIIKNFLPKIQPETLHYVSQVLYPPVYNASTPYKDPVQRVALALSEIFVECNNEYLTQAFNLQAHQYLFSVPPAIHGQDTLFTFYNHISPAIDAFPFNATTAKALQDYFVSFAASGTPSSALGPTLEKYSAGEEVLNVGLKNISMIRDPVRQQVCQFWLEHQRLSG